MDLLPFCTGIWTRAGVQFMKNMNTTSGRVRSEFEGGHKGWRSRAGRDAVDRLVRAQGWPTRDGPQDRNARVPRRVAIAAATLPASAQNATWRANPDSGNFNTAANWSPGTVPTGIASFGSSSRTAISFSANTTVADWLFIAPAAYTFSNQVA